MSFTIPSLIIENGLANTRAGFLNDEVPPLVFLSHYGQNSVTKEVFIGDDIYLKNRASGYKDLEIYLLLHDGLVYNWDHLEDNWRYIWDRLKLRDRYPLVVTEAVWNTKQNRAKTAELAFENFDVAALNVLKNPLCVTYGLGKSSGLVVDVGAAVTSVTGVVDGNVLAKLVVHSKFAGDFLNYRVYTFLKQAYYPDQEIIGKRLQGVTGATESFKRFDLNNTLLSDFKSSVLTSYQYPITEQNIGNLGLESKNYRLPDGRTISVGSEHATLTEALYKPQAFVPKEQQGSSQGIVDMILTSLNRFRDTPEVISQLLSNIVITGGSSSIPDLDKRLYFDLSSSLQHFHISCYFNPNVLQRQHAVWCGAGILSSLNTFDSFMLKLEYEEVGADGVGEKFK